MHARLGNAARRALAVSLLLSACPSPSQARFEEGKPAFHFTRNDSQQHFWISAGGTLAVSQGLRAAGMRKSWAIGTTACGSLALGAAKEFARDKHPSFSDLWADALGTLLGAGISVAIRF